MLHIQHDQRHWVPNKPCFSWNRHFFLLENLIILPINLGKKMIVYRVIYTFLKQIILCRKQVVVIDYHECLISHELHSILCSSTCSGYQLNHICYKVMELYGMTNVFSMLLCVMLLNCAQKQKISIDKDWKNHS